MKQIMENELDERIRVLGSGQQIGKGVAVVQECLYCSRDEKLDEQMLEIRQLNTSILYLHKEQTYPGRCVIALNEHQRELFHLKPEMRAMLMEDIANVASAIEKAFLPDKINYGSYGDLMPHLHFHIVPKYRTDDSWGKPFDLDPKKVYLSDEEYQSIIERIIRHLP